MAKSWRTQAAREAADHRTVMVQVSLDPKSFEDVLKRIREAPGNIGNKAARPAIRAGGKVFLERAKVLTPVYRKNAQSRRKRGRRSNPFYGRRPSVLWKRRPRRTPLPVPGLLRRSLGVRAMKRKKGRIGVVTQSVGSKTLFAGRDYYGGYLEFGTKTRSSRYFDGRQQRIKPIGYLKRSYRERDQHAAYVVQREMARRLDAAVMGRGGGA